MPRMDRLSKYNTFWTTSETGGIVGYSRTQIVVWDQAGIKLNSDGWRTVTTKRKMNQASNQFGLGYGVYQRKGEWFVGWKGQELPYYDGMTLAR